MNPSSTLRLPTPLAAIVASTLFFGAFHLCSPFSFASEYEPTSWMMLLLNLVAISIPAIVCQFRERNMRLFTSVSSAPPVDPRILLVGLWSLVLLSLLGMALKSYDLFVIRGFSFADNVNELYTRNNETNASIAGLIASVLYPLGYPTLIVLLWFRRKFRSPGLAFAIVLALASCAMSPINAMVLGKRGAVFAVTLLLVLAWVFNGVRVRTRALVLSILIATGLFVFSARMLNHRLELKGASSERAVSTASFTDLITLNPSYKAISRRKSVPLWVRSTMYDWAAFHGYVVHAVPEYLHVVENFDSKDLQYGKFTFSLVAKLLSFFVDVEYDKTATASVLPRPYVYTSLFGPLYVDFGRFSLVVSLAFGVLLVVTYGIARKCVFAVPFYLYLFAVALISPMVCFLSMFYGFYFGVASLIAWGSLWVLSRTNLRQGRMVQLGKTGELLAK